MRVHLVDSVSYITCRLGVLKDNRSFVNQTKDKIFVKKH